MVKVLVYNIIFQHFYYSALLGTISGCIEEYKIASYMKPEKMTVY